jgi:hypothetical protein
MDTRPRAKRGPKPKGNRVRISAALPAEVYDQALAIAERDGQTLTDVLGRLLAEALDLPVPSYCLPKSSNQGELPLIRAS